MELQTAPERNGTAPDWNQAGPDRLTAAAAAALLGVTDRTLRKWAKEGRLTRQFGQEGHPWYSRAEVEALRNGSDRSHPETGPERPRVRNGPTVIPLRNGTGPGRNGTGPEWNRTGPDSPDNGPLNGARQPLSPDAAGAAD